MIASVRAAAGKTTGGRTVSGVGGGPSDVTGRPSVPKTPIPALGVPPGGGLDKPKIGTQVPGAPKPPRPRPDKRRGR